MTETKKYTRNQSSLRVLAAVDNEFTRAAANLVIAVGEGAYAADQDLQTLAAGFQEAFGKESPQKIFGSRLGYVKPKGKPLAYGLKPEDIVSAHIELERRKLGSTRGTLQRAQELTVEAFIDISEGDAIRQVRRDWQNGKNTVQGLSEADLQSLLEPYEIT